MCETAAAYHRHDISDRAWNILAPLLPGGPGKVGRPAQDNLRSATPCSGYSAPAPPDATFPQTTATAAPCLAGSAVGVRRASGPNCRKR